MLQQAAATVKHDRLAKKILQNGNRFGRQYVVFQARHAYPAYVVKYSLVPDDAITELPVVKVKSSPHWIHVTVADKSVYRDNPRALKHSFLLTKINFETLDVAEVTLLPAIKSVAETMSDYFSSLALDEVVVVAAAKLPVRSQLSPVMTDVLRSLRSVGGSLHVMDGPYVLVGAKQPHLLTGLVHEDHQPTEAGVEVDLRVIRHNRDTPAAIISQSHSVTKEDMKPVRWQQQDKRNPNGVAWEDLREVGPKLTAAYQKEEEHVVINGHTVDLVKMKVRGGPKIRCLNLKGETLAPVARIINK